MNPVTTQPGLTPPPSYNKVTDHEPPSYREAMKVNEPDILTQIPLDEVESDGDQTCCCQAAKYRNNCCLYYVCKFFEDIGKCTDFYCEACADCIFNCCEEKPEHQGYATRTTDSNDHFLTSGANIWESHRVEDNNIWASQVNDLDSGVDRDTSVNHNSSTAHDSSGHHSSTHHSSDHHSSTHHSSGHHSSTHHSSDHHSSTHHSSDHHSSNHHSSDHHTSDNTCSFDSGGFSGGDSGGGDCGGGMN